MIVALAGGVGGARLALGLVAQLPPSRLTIVVNTGDDFEHLGLHVSPALDTVRYTLAGVNNPATGWGLAGETWQFMTALKQLGGPGWFNLGDRDLAVHLLRTQALRKGISLSAITTQLARRFGLWHAIVPMSDDPVRTRVKTSRGELAFQDYFVREQCRPRVQGFRFIGSRKAAAAPALQKLMHGGTVRAVVICPSNPFVSVAPILSVPAIRAWLKQRNFPVVAVSPIVGGAAIKGPAAKIMRELGREPSALAVAQHYRGLIDGLVVDNADACQAEAIRALGMAVHVTDTIMTDVTSKRRLAEETLAFAARLTR